MAQAIPYLLMATGTLISANGQRQAGKAQNEMYKAQANMEQAKAQREAQVLEIKANETQAVSQRRAMEERRQSRVKQSRALAVAASSGAGAVDPTVLDIVGGLENEGDLAASNELYQGTDQSNWQKYQAAATRVQGDNTAGSLRVQGKIAKNAANSAALGTLIGGAGSMYSMFSAPKPAMTPAPVAQANMVPTAIADAGNGKKWWMQ